MAEQETVQKSEYHLELEKIEAKYDEKVKAIDKFEHLAHTEIPKLAELLKNVQPDGTVLSDDDIVNQLHKDCKKYWTPQWIDKCLPENFRRKYEKEESEEEEESLPSSPTDHPEADLIRELKQQLKGAEKARTDAQKLYDKAHTKIDKMNTEISELKEQMKGFKQSSKLLETIKPIYDEELNALHLTVAGMSNTKITEYFEKHQSKPISDPTEFIFKLGKNIVLESID